MSHQNKHRPSSGPEDRTPPEDALRESQQVISAILDAVPARIFWKDKNSVYLGCNVPFARDAGFDDPSDVIGKSDAELTWRDQAQSYRRDDREVVETGRSKLLIEEPQTTPDGGLMTLLTSKVPLRRSNGEIFGVLGTYLDVTERARLEKQLAFSNLLHATAVENSPDAIVIVDQNGRMISFNKDFADLWRIPSVLMAEGIYEPVLRSVEAQLAEPAAFMARIRHLDEHSEEKGHNELHLRDGRVIDWHTAPLRDAQHGYLGRICYYRDITERERARATIEKQYSQFEAALENMVQGLLMYASTGRLTVTNRRFAQMFGVPWEKWQALAPGTTVPETMQLVEDWTGTSIRNRSQIIAEHQNIIESRRSGKLVFEVSDGRTFSSACAPMADGGSVITFEDITEQRRIQDQITHMAHYDALTDLPNRAQFYEEMEGLLAHAPGKTEFAVLSLDLDRFKSVNDTLGHPIGDELLKAAAERMRGCLREGDVVARLGGDEFAILQVSFGRPRDATLLASRLIDTLTAPYQLNGHQVMVGASVGIAIAPNDGTASDQLMKNADLALYRCKSEGGDAYRFFEARMDARMQERRALEIDLRKALVNQEFTLNYQPIVNLKTGRVTSCEALIRWHHPVRGTVPPRDFIQIAEETGLICPIGQWVLERACADAITWPEDIAVSVNVSSVQFRAGDFLRTVVNALDKSGLAASRLELEITEMVLMHDSEATLSLLHKLKDLGVNIAMDDFGTGYSSLGYLRSFPFDRIKIDESFIRDLPDREESLAILRAVVGLGSSLHMTTTAEGVETHNQLEMLRSEGCADVQGYLFSPPRPAAEVHAILTSLQGQAPAVA